MSDNAPREDAAPRPWAADPETRDRHARYWRRNIRYVAILIAIWFTVSYGFGILLAGPLNRFTIPGTGFPLGFWFAQQGSIYVFVVLIFVYVWLMNRLDREFDVDEVAPGARSRGATGGPGGGEPGTAGPGRGEPSGAGGPE